MLRESKGNMYSWINATWNPIKGECPHGCTYCYMKRWGKQKPVHFDEKELNTDLGADNFIFVGSSCDIFADEISEKWILEALNYCESFVKNKYLFQSKNPIRMIDFELVMPEPSVLCTTLETNRWYQDIMKFSPNPVKRVDGMARSMKYNYVTIEPVMDFDLNEFIEMLKDCEPVQVSIGADSGNNHLPEPSKEKILVLIDELKKFTIIDQKRNLQRLLK